MLRQQRVDVNCRHCSSGALLSQKTYLDKAVKKNRAAVDAQSRVKKKARLAATLLSKEGLSSCTHVAQIDQLAFQSSA